MHDTKTEKERFVLIAVDDDRQGDTEANLDELALLCETAGAEVVGRLVQKREGVHPGHYLGKGKLDELADLISLHNATGIVADDELSSNSQHNLSNILKCKILDRTTVILDIFADHATTAEGKTQVELAQLKYRLSHLAGLGGQLSRLGGGIGTRGPGEKKLETDRRHIRGRINHLNSELKEITSKRSVLREKRGKAGITVFSAVGYTNAGKSTLMNALTGAVGTDRAVLAENKLFATLDTTVRKLNLKYPHPNGPEYGDIYKEALFTDTVGFIQKLPHTLIQAFRATLEEMNFADVLVHVVDASNPACAQQMKVVYDTLSDLKCINKPIITVFNKTDLDIERPLPLDRHAVHTIEISAKTGKNIDALYTLFASMAASNLHR